MKLFVLIAVLSFSLTAEATCLGSPAQCSAQCSQAGYSC